MKRNIVNKSLLLILSFAIFLATIPVSSKSQTDTIPSSFKNGFNKNLNELGDLFCWSDSTFYPGEFYFEPIVNIEEKFQQLGLPFFQEYLNQTELYLRFLENLTIAQRQNLIRFYSYYEKEFETVFLNEGLPAELKYLAPAISAMNPMATGLDKRAGLWQLTHFQAVLNGLEISKLVDERFNISLSTFVAAKQIKQNFDQFITYDLAIIAHVFGKVEVRNAMDLAAKNNGETVDYLPESGVGKIALVQAMSIFLKENRFKNNVDLFTAKVQPDTVKINREMHFRQVNEVLHISEKQLQFLNPQYKFSIIPGNKKSYKLVLPNGKWDDFVLWQDSIYNSYDSTLFQLLTQKIEYPPSPSRQYSREPVKDLEIEGKTKIKYLIKTGDVLGIIAENYDVRVADLKYWNNIYNERRIQAGKKLDVFVDNDKVDYYLSLASPEKKKTEANSMATEFQNASTLKVFEDFKSAKKIEHTVKSGESPYVIAQKYKGVTADQILEWNNINDARKIQIGQILIVYIKNETR